MNYIIENIDKTFFKNFVWCEDVVYNNGYNNLYFINPRFGHCVLMLSRHGKLYWSGELFEDTFYRYFGLSLSGFRLVLRQYVHKNIEDGRPIVDMKKRKVINYPKGLFF